MNQVTKFQVKRILNDHGIDSLDTCTYFDGCEHNGQCATFHIDMGVKDHYTVKEIKDWLGY